jgi:hypothetical protein
MKRVMVMLLGGALACSALATAADARGGGFGGGAHIGGMGHVGHIGRLSGPYIGSAGAAHLGGIGTAHMGTLGARRGAMGGTHIGGVADGFDPNPVAQGFGSHGRRFDRDWVGVNGYSPACSIYEPFYRPWCAGDVDSGIMGD